LSFSVQENRFMTRPQQHSNAIIARLAALAVVSILLGSITAHAQTFTVLHEFTGGTDGSNPYSSLAMDRSGNLYGVAPFGGQQSCETQNGIGCGTAFKLSHRGGGWTFATLYEFTAGAGGSVPIGTPFIASDGTIYGTTDGGGNLNCRDLFADGCGTVFHLRPQPTFCPSLSCPWTNTKLYTFTGGSDGNDPYTGVVLDGAGNIYGTAYSGGSSQLGVAYELSPSGSGWTQSTIHTFIGGNDGANPASSPALNGGDLYGTTSAGGGCGGIGCGTVFQLTPAGSEWNENILYNFSGSFGTPLGGLIFDTQGNLYGSASIPNSVFELSPSNGSWSATLLYSNESLELQSFRSSLARDAAGNLYGTSEFGGQSECSGYGCGFVYKLTPSSGGWTFTQLYSFTGGSDGSLPIGGVVLDSSGNLYGTTFSGGSHSCGSMGCGVVWEISQ
jgi:uncharacterized repeat protein (TIGR03803 family)